MFGSMLNLLFMTLVIVFCVDLSGAIDKLNRFVGKKLYPTVKYVDWQIPLISCSLCSTWGAGLLYLTITSSLSGSMVAYLTLLAFLTPVISTVLLFIKDALLRLLDVLYDTINK